MCSVTHCRSGSRLLLTMNRDEFRRRHPELSPQKHSLANGGCWIAPSDGEPPNTWIGVAGSGFGGCVLNRYQDREAPPGNVSRGALLPAMLRETGIRHVDEWLRETLSRAIFSPFTLIVFGPEKSLRFDWTGSRLDGPRGIAEDGCEESIRDATWTLVTSSSWRSKAVIRWRQSLFLEWIREGAPFRERIPSFHLMCPPNLASWAPLMSRRQTATRSITQIALDPGRGRVELSYWAMPHPHSREPSSHWSLPLEEAGHQP